MSGMERTIASGVHTLYDKLFAASSDRRRFTSAISRLNSILTKRQLSLLITTGPSTVIIGDRMIDRHPVQFIFASEDALRRVLSRLRLIDFATCYFDESLQIEGSILKAVRVLDAINAETDRKQTWGEYLRFAAFRAAKAVSFNWATRFDSLDHYSTSAKVYEAFLDPYMQYTCGRFDSGAETLEEAQISKFRLIRRLFDEFGEELNGKAHLDIGCGWGGLVAYFSANFGTRSLGNTNCPRQAEYARSRYGAEVFLADFSELAELGSKFDLVTIVGMIEHLTPRRRSQLLKLVGRLLNPGGLVYLQCITKPSIWIGGDAYRVVQRDVFPGHYLETAERTRERLMDCGFEVLTQLDHGLDYGLTTSKWVEGLQQREAELTNLIDAKSFRIYLGYLAYASNMFMTGRGNLTRFLLRKV